MAKQFQPRLFYETPQFEELIHVDPLLLRIDEKCFRNAFLESLRELGSKAANEDTCVIVEVEAASEIETDDSRLVDNTEIEAKELPSDDNREPYKPFLAADKRNNPKSRAKKSGYRTAAQIAAREHEKKARQDRFA